MDVKKIIKSAKKEEDEKVGFSLKIPRETKKKLQEICNKEKVSMNALIVATIEEMIEEESKQAQEVSKI